MTMTSNTDRDALRRALGRVRLIALDVDGTSINSKGVCTPHTRQVLQRVIDRGYLLVPATGRAYAGLVGGTLPLDGVQYVISADGAIVTRCADGVRIRQSLIPCATAAALAADLMRGTNCVYYHRDDPPCTHVMACRSREIFFSLKKYPEQDDGLWNGVIQDGLDRRILAEGRDVVKMGMWFPIQEGFEGYENLVRQKYPDVSFFRADDNVLEFTAAHTSKGTALQALAGELGIPMEQTLAIGDNRNDVDMIRRAGVGVAMGNAIPETKQCADWIARTQDEDGTADFLEEFLL